MKLTDEDARIMPGTDGFQQCYNAQASVDIDTHLIVEQHVSQRTNDQQEITSAVGKLQQLPEVLGEVDALLTDAGYFSEANVKACKACDIVPWIAPGRQRHNEALLGRFAADPVKLENPDGVEAMRGRLKTRKGKAIYARRKSTVETVFGIIKQVLGFRQFLLRGVENISSEWSLVCIGWNLKRLHALKG